MPASFERDLPADPDIRRILVIRWSAMGDVALASAGFEDIARAFPDAVLDLNTLPPWHRLFEADPRFGEVLVTPFKSGGRRFGGIGTWVREVARRRYDLIIDFQSTDRARLLTTALWVAGGQARWRLGNRRDFPYNLGPARRPEPVHALDRIRDTLASGGIPATTERPVLHVPAASRERAAQWRERHGLEDDRYGVFLPGSQAAGFLKRWGAERFARLGAALHAQGLHRILILGGPDEIEECRQIERQCPDYAVNLCGQTELLDIVPLCEGARFVLANHTGTAHVAAAAGRPMLVICGPTDPRKVLPAGPAVRPLQLDLPCINCYRKTCSHHSCMVNLTPARVLDELTRTVHETG